MTAALRESLLAGAIILAAVLILGWPLITTAALPAGSDVVFAYHSAHGFSQALSEGVLYPRWVANSNNAFGGPTFIYYCPLPYYVVGLATLLTGNQVLAFRLVLLLVAWLSGLTLYRAARPLTTSLGAALAAATYVLVPYHALDLYDRFAFAEYCSFIWFPLILLGLRRALAAQRSRSWLLLAAAFTGLLFTHLVTAYMVGLVLGPYALYLAARQRTWRNLGAVAGAALVALAAAAIYLLPMIVQRPDVHLEWVVDAPYGDWQRNFVYRDEVALGYARAPIKPWVNRVTSTQALLSFAAIALIAGARLRARARTPDQTPALRHEGEALTLLALWTFFLQVPLSSPVWSLVPELGTVQFPWRFGLFQGLVTALLVACAWGQGRQASNGRRQALLTALVLALFALPALWVSLRLIDHPVRPLNFDSALASRPYYLSRVMTEYLPRDMQDWQEFSDRAAPAVPAARMEGSATVRVIAWETHRRVLRVNAPQPDRLVLRTFHHPGWTARLQDRPLPIDAGNPMHQITVAVPPGEHDIVVEFNSTPDRRWGAALSLAGLATMLLLGGRRFLAGLTPAPEEGRSG